MAPPPRIIEAWIAVSLVVAYLSWFGAPVTFEKSFFTTKAVADKALFIPWKVSSYVKYLGFYGMEAVREWNAVVAEVESDQLGPDHPLTTTLHAGLRAMDWITYTMARVGNFFCVRIEPFILSPEQYLVNSMWAYDGAYLGGLYIEDVIREFISTNYTVPHPLWPLTANTTMCTEDGTGIFNCSWQLGEADDIDVLHDRFLIPGPILCSSKLVYGDIYYVNDVIIPQVGDESIIALPMVASRPSQDKRRFSVIDMWLLQHQSIASRTPCYASSLGDDSFTGADVSIKKATDDVLVAERSREAEITITNLADASRHAGPRAYNSFTQFYTEDMATGIAICKNAHLSLDHDAVDDQSRVPTAEEWAVAVMAVARLKRFVL